MSEATRLLRLLALCAPAVASCHQFEACGPGVDCDSSRARGGASGADGAEHVLSCSGRFANCDNAAANGCETDLDSSPIHCGACQAACAGICNEGRCMAYQVAATDQKNPTGGIVLTSEFAYFAAERVAGGGASLRLQRVSRRALSDLESLAEGYWSSIEGLAVTSHKLYVLGDYGLFSLRLPDAVEVVEEQEPGDTFIESIDARGRYLYLSDYRSVYLREETDDVVKRVLYAASATGVRVAATSEGFFAFVENELAGQPPGYEVFHGWHGDTEPRRLASGQGSISVFAAFEDEAYFTVADGQSFTLRRARDDGEQIVTTEADHVAGLAFAGGDLISAISADFRSGFRVFYAEDGELLHDWPTTSPALELEADANGELWYFDEASAALVRLYPYRFPERP